VVEESPVQSGAILGVDYGRRRIGLAIARWEMPVARPLETLNVTSIQDALTQVVHEVRASGARRLVIGLPLHMSGAESEMAAEVRRFAADLERAAGIPVALSEERLTSVEAERNLRGSRLRGRERKARVDSIAAQLLLQTYLDREVRRRGEMTS
jgi:putative Holliday junction resolvase